MGDDIAANRTALGQLADDRTLVNQVTAIITSVESTRGQALNLLGEAHPNSSVVNGAAAAAADALGAAHEAVERFLQEILNAAALGT